MEERLQKVLARFGISSRRKAEEFIAEGRVTVNGVTASLGMKADPSRDHIKVDGKLCTETQPKVYYKFNKPRGVVTSLADPEGRQTVADFLKDTRYRVFPVGRLDYDSEGLLIVTNDGALAHAVMHPSKKIPKVYLVKVKGLIGNEDIEKLRKGVRLEDGMTAPARVLNVRHRESNCWVEMSIHEGKKRQIRRMFEKIGYTVIRLIRVAIDGLKLGDLRPGEMRAMAPEELQQLKKFLQS
ncbi:MAG TPA: pseudouridine synthase [Dissulfurispiraceae bacterium]|nr:pseudouridine synthase [Dissulfurispiraceae bacterium]